MTTILLHSVFMHVSVCVILEYITVVTIVGNTTRNQSSTKGGRNH